MNLFVIILIETLDFQFPTELNPFNVLVSVVHETESKIHKAVKAKEAELTKERKGVNTIYNGYINSCFTVKMKGIF